MREIKEIGDNIQESLSLTEKLYSLLVEEDVRVNKVNQFKLQAESWKAAREVGILIVHGGYLDSRTDTKGYKTGIRIIKEAVAVRQTVAVQRKFLILPFSERLTSSPIAAFVKIWSKLAEQGPDSDVVIEFKNFSEKVRLTHLSPFNHENCIQNG